MWEGVRMDDELIDSAMTALSQLNPRRFGILVEAVRIGRPFVTRDLREAAPAASLSLARDLNALESGGLLRADPPRGASRQGRPVTYSVAPVALTVFRDLAAVIESASATPSTPSATGTA